MGSTALNKPRIVGAVMLWTLTIVELLGMGLAGMAKFQGDVWREMFMGWGYAPWFAFVIGAAEVVGALALLIPSLASYAASMLIVIMSGAIWTVAASTNETGLGPGLPAIHIAVLSIILYARRGRRWRGYPLTNERSMLVPPSSVPNTRTVVGVSSSENVDRSSGSGSS